MGLSKGFLGTIRSRLKEPVIANKSLDLLAALFWLCIAGWGITSSITGLPTIKQSTNLPYEFFWGACIGVFGSIAFVSALGTVVGSQTLGTRIHRKTVELFVASILTGFIAVYPLFVIGLVFAGDLDRFSTIFSSSAFLLVPVWRVFHLTGRIRALRAVSKTGPLT